jgi:hypothetical protein
MRNVNLFYLFLLMALLLGSCTENAGTTENSANNLAAVPASQKISDTFHVEPEVQSGDLSDLFTYHKKLNINNNITFDVLGIGAQTAGNYLILKNDKAKNTYTSITGDKQGRIIHSSATDMDADHQIEVILFIRNKADTKGNLIIHEIDSLNNQNRINLPELTSDLADGYSGQDTFYVQNNKIIREFPVTGKKTATQAARTDKRRIEYVLKSNALLPSSHERWK